MKTIKGEKMKSFYQVIDCFGSVITKSIPKKEAEIVAEKEQKKTGYRHFVRDIRRK